MMSKRKFMLYLSVLVVLFLFSLLIGYIFYPKPKTNDLMITNITGNGVTISWLSDDPSKESIVVSKNEVGFKEVLSQERFYDDRDTDYNDKNEIVVDAKSRHTHHVTIFGLLPETEYHFAIANKYKTADIDLSKFTTAKLDEELFAPDPVYAGVLNDDMSIDPPKDGIVYYQLYNPGEFQVTSQVYSTTLNENASWAGDIAGIKTVSGDKFITTDTTIISVDVKTSDGNGQESYQLVDYKPLPILYIKSDIDTSNSTNVLVNKVMADENCGGDACEAGGACYPSGFIAENTSTSTGDPIGTYVCGNGTWQMISKDITPRFGPAIQPSCPDNEEKECKDSYMETCNINGQVGTKKCTKIGKSPCGVTGTACSWGPDSGCTACDVSSESEPINVTDTGRKLLEQYPAQESKSARGPGAASVVAGSSCVFRENGFVIEITGGTYGDIEVIASESGCRIGAETITSDSIISVSQSLLTTKSSTFQSSEWLRIYRIDSDGISINDGVMDMIQSVNLMALCRSEHNNEDLKKHCELDFAYEDGTKMSIGDFYCDQKKAYQVTGGTQNPPRLEFDNRCVSNGLYRIFILPRELEADGSDQDGAVAPGNQNNLCSAENYVDGCTCPGDNIFAQKKRKVGDIACFNGKPGQVYYDSFSIACLNYNLSEPNPYNCNSVQDGELALNTTGLDIKNILGTKVLAQTTSNLEVTDSGYYQTYIGDDFENPIAEFAVNLDGADKANVTLFIDTNGNGLLDAGETTLSDYSQIKLKKETEAAKYNLISGWNLIALPLISNEGIKTANDLIDHFNKQGADIKHVAKYTQSGFVIYTKREGDTSFANNFSLVPGQGYFVLNYSPKEVLLKGNKFDQSIPINIQNGWNLIGVYTNEKPYTGSNLLKDLASDGIVADTVSKYQSGMYQNLVMEDNVVYGNDYSIIERQGYFLKVTQGGGENIKFTPLPEKND